MLPREFQSTPPARGATGSFTFAPFFIASFQSTPPRGGRPPAHWPLRCRRYFNPRPREGGDAALRHSNTPPYYISIHAPAKGATPSGNVLCLRLVVISIHAPREGGRQVQSDAGTEDKVFQSTPPARGATRSRIWILSARAFQSTPPARGATLGVLSVLPVLPISIHAPREGGRHRLVRWICQR